MIFAEMRTEVEILYEFVNSNAAPGFTDAEWGTIFTAAQRRIVLKILADGVANGAFNRLAIEALIKTIQYNTWTTSTYYLNTDGTAAKELDDTFDVTLFWILDEYVTSSTYPRIPLKTITFEEYQANLSNPFKKPDLLEGFWVIHKTGVPTIITDGTTILLYNIVGVEHPDNYAIASGSDCVLNESVHSLIVADAMKLARMSVNDAEGFQIAVAADAI